MTSQLPRIAMMAGLTASVTAVLTQTGQSFIQGCMQR
jgi:hypothetical protein